LKNCHKLEMSQFLLLIFCIFVMYLLLYIINNLVLYRDKRKKTDPWTPDKYTKCSKRCWDGMVRSWRRQLHNWDPVSDEDMKMDMEPSSDTLTMNSFNNNDPLDLNDTSLNDINNNNIVNNENNSRTSNMISNNNINNNINFTKI